MKPNRAPKKDNESNCRDLVIVRAPWFFHSNFVQLLSQLNKVAAEYKALDEDIERVVRYIAQTHFAKEVELMLDLAQTHEELYSAYHRESGRVNFNVTGVNTTLYAAFESGRLVAKVDEIRLKDLYRKVASVTHTDRGGGDAALFGLARFLYTSKDLEGLYLLWISVVSPVDHDLASLAQRCAFVVSRTDALRIRLKKLYATQSFKALQCWMGGNQEMAKACVREILFVRVKQLASDIYGLEALQKASQ